MNYIVIGEPCVDVIHSAEGKTISSYGGILYSVISLAVLARTEDIIYPVMNLGEDEYTNITGILKKYKNINQSGIYKVAHPTRKVNLYYQDYGSGKRARLEYSTLPTYTLDYKFIEPFLKYADAVLVNMISGVDINLDTMKKIRNYFDGKIHIDIHNLVMKTNPDGSREHIHLENWLDWCTNADTLQMNEFEVNIISETHKKEREIAEEILLTSGSKRKTEAVIITRGKEGSSGYIKVEKQGGRTINDTSSKFFDLAKIDVPAAESPHFEDSTGCGDIFASAFLLDYSGNNDVRKAMNYASRIASVKISLRGIDELDKLKNNE